MKWNDKNSFHIEPVQGLLNDPNGLIQFKGKYYFFHQWNRFDTDHTYKEWGLFTSTDLVNWENPGTAIVPDQKEDKDGIYSGSAVEKAGMLYVFYTGNTKENNVRKSAQKIAISSDGKTFVKKNQGIKTPEGFTEHHRDPKVWQSQGKWWMIVGAQTTQNVGAITLFVSLDLLHWEFQGTFYTDSALEQMCECPDVFSLTNDVDILTVCPQRRTSIEENDLSLSSYAGYLIGKIDYKKKKFVPESDILLLDYGFDFYAPQSFEDDKGRRIMVAWMSRMSELEEAQCPTTKSGYVHCLTMPRELKWLNNQLRQVPLEEYKQLRKEEQKYTSANAVIKNCQKAYEILIDLGDSTPTFYLTLNAGMNSLEYKKGLLQISRINWVSGKKEMKELALEELHSLQIFCDNSTVEFFINEGQYVFSMRSFCDSFSREITYQELGKKGSVVVYNY
ncbi:glycoside hydrolase family 32 protein [Candidatus Enterococcus ferrettii]|uniref:Sucrose-6-phosphate hydrolase n=1 Tax=Candidatus Enterococcus ferrettii TaxID=2815324 RepID=A0ABV0EVG1_9ENTE|nr:glycoside hydrolase family 32 protein [Enterococcus sp. 665A]MBO1342377.1 glycoside hydrolase family 32 protein [Enterococcus sp. 665A]